MVCHCASFVPFSLDWRNHFSSGSRLPARQSAGLMNSPRQRPRLFSRAMISAAFIEVWSARAQPLTINCVRDVRINRFASSSRNSALSMAPLFLSEDWPVWSVG